MKPTFNNRQNVSHKIGDKEVWESRSAAVVGIILAFSKDGIYVLAEKRSMKMPEGPGKWVVPCGYIDWDENGWNALRREVYEETSFFIDKYSKYIIYDNNQQPFYVMTEPRENRQNVAINYIIVFDFNQTKLPTSIEKYKDEEVDKIKWVNLKEINNYDWAFEHKDRVKMGINNFKSYLYR